MSYFLILQGTHHIYIYFFFFGIGISVFTNTFTTPVDFSPFLYLNIFAPGNSQEVKWNYQKKDFKWLKILEEFNADL